MKTAHQCSPPNRRTPSAPGGWWLTTFAQIMMKESRHHPVARSAGKRYGRRFILNALLFVGFPAAPFILDAMVPDIRLGWLVLPLAAGMIVLWALCSRRLLGFSVCCPTCGRNTATIQSNEMKESVLKCSKCGWESLTGHSFEDTGAS